jgi:hypothetical protein
MRLDPHLDRLLDILVEVVVDRVLDPEARRMVAPKLQHARVTRSGVTKRAVLTRDSAGPRPPIKPRVLKES